MTWHRARHLANLLINVSCCGFANIILSLVLEAPLNLAPLLPSHWAHMSCDLVPPVRP